MEPNFAVLIISHGRADRVYTYKALRNAGYTGKIILIVDNEDSDADNYIKNFGQNNVVIFDKLAKSRTIDSMDLVEDRRTDLYARCVSFDVAEQLGLTYFLLLDDDYVNFRSRVVSGDSLKTIYIKNFDTLVEIVLEFLETSKADTVALSQIGDFIGGKNSKVCKERLVRKAMNAFFCKTANRIVWSGRMNADVTAYISQGSRGRLFFTIADVSIDQLPTQSVKGGSSEVYKESGTYMKTFYSILASPSSVYVYTVGESHHRFHHRIDWERAVPKIISDRYKRGEKE